MKLYKMTNTTKGTRFVVASDMVAAIASYNRYFSHTPLAKIKTVDYLGSVIMEEVA